MTAKEYLSEIQRLQTIIERKEAHIKDLREMACSIRAVSYEHGKIKSSSYKDHVGDIASKITDFEIEVQHDISGLLTLKHKIVDQICEL